MNIKHFFFFLVRPTFWVQNYPTSDIVDDLIRNLDWNDVEVTSEYHVKVGGVELWRANHPYASFQVCGLLPKRMTRYMLMKKIKKEIDAYEENKIRQKFK